MNRRAFLATLAASMGLDADRLLWVPGAKLVSIPKPRVFPRGDGSVVGQFQKEGA